MAVPEIMLAAIRRFCRQATPHPLDREVLVEMTVRGNFVTIWERRPPSDDTSDEWTRMHAAQMRYNPADATWSLYWRYRNRWEPYDARGEPLSLQQALTVVGEDRLGAFFG